MNSSILKVMTIASVLALVSAAPAYSEDATGSAGPKGYTPLGEICIGGLTGDIVLPEGKTTDVSEQVKPGR